MYPQTKNTKIESIIFFLFQIIVLVSSFFFIPSSIIPFDVGRTAFVFLAVLIIFFLWSITRLKDGLFEVPKSFLYASSGFFVLVYGIIALFSQNKIASISGQFFEIGTLASVFIVFLLFALIPLIIKNEKKFFRIYVLFFVSVAIVGIYQLLRLIFGPTFFSFDIFTSTASNLVGKWNDMGIFFGLSALLSIITLECATPKKYVKYLVYLTLVLSLIFIAVVGFSTIWIALSIFLAIFFIYTLSLKKEVSVPGQPREVQFIALTVFALSLVFSFAGQNMNVVPSTLGISQIEVRPSWSATMDISKATLTSHPLFGVGPNRFSSEWLLQKPQGINTTLFWNTNFNYGFGFIPSLISTSGIIGFLSLLLFISLFLWSGIRGLFSNRNNTFNRYFVLSSFLSSLYLWLFAFIYVPSITLVALMMIFTGLFVSALVLNGSILTTRFSLLESPIKSFISVLLTVLVLIGIVSFAYKVSMKVIANMDFQKSVLAFNKAGNLDLGEKYLNEAISLSPIDTYYRLMTELYLVRVNNLLNDKSISIDEARTKFQNLLSVAISSSQKAIAYDNTKYENHIGLGRVFEAVVPLNISGAYESAKQSYEKALVLNPHSPEVYLILGRLELANKKNDKAIEYIRKALTEKSDYADAIFLLSQIEINQGKLSEAVKSLKDVSVISPNDPGIFFQLGLLQYNQKDYKGSFESFTRAVTLNNQYANAKYFLGLSNYQLDNVAEAIKQFEDIKITNPDNNDLNSIITNLKAGRPPFGNPPTSSPERGSKAPIRESSSGQ